MKQIILIIFALVVIVGINLIPEHSFSGQNLAQSKKGMVEFQCIETPGTYWKCSVGIEIPCTVILPNDCEPINE